MSIVMGAATALMFWWLIVYEGAWPFLILVPVPAIPSLLFSLYAIKAHESDTAFLGLLMAVSPIAIFFA
ncbi:hypothetical protein DMY87_10975 [Rhizobium wuzhouense]|uniref:Uncharacterized protein n=1 Tax=Rhizobium wuzhouense TaxID=1986026 RepID=A0ABX5NUK6_9HYPH|nr:hypothetical protein DMY87_10975 [Rhizobium wuzhouense]